MRGAVGMKEVITINTHMTDVRDAVFSCLR